MVMAYDYPSALHVTRVKIDILLVRDLVEMVKIGYDTTLPMMLDQMIHHCQSVKRGTLLGAAGVEAQMPLLVGDMTFST